MTTLRETIRELTARHLDAGHLVMGQNLTAVGWVGGTLPERHDMTELPMSDVANSGFVVGAALAGRRPIYVVRYQGFQHLNAAMIVNYAAKSKALWGRSCPLLVRSIAMEGGIGPTSGSSHHSLFTRMPGVKVFAPMTPGEWRAAYDEFMAGDDPVYLSEHRGAYENDAELPSHRIHTRSRADVMLFPISITRFTALQAAAELVDEGIVVGICHISQLKQFHISDDVSADLEWTQFGGIVLDDDYASGVASDIAQQLHTLTSARMRVLALPDRTAGFGPGMDVLPPNAERIKTFVKEIVR